MKNGNEGMANLIEIENLQKENMALKKRAQEAEGELTIIRGIGNTSPEMKSLQAQVEELKKEIALVREDARIEIMRRDERIKETERINKLHQELNGKLQLELTRLKGGL